MSTDREQRPESSGVIAYALEPNLDVAEFAEVLRRSTLAERRPMSRPDVLERMITGADLIVTARDGGRLVGIARALTDFSYCVYLADLAVDEQYQRRGIGRELIQRTHAAAGPHTALILLAAPKAESYYPHIGMKAHHSCWIIERTPYES
jgi:predicted N-acetyltransferase YhbS